MGRRTLILLLAALLAATACSGSEEASDSEDRVDAPRAGEVRLGAAEDIWPLYGPGRRSRTFAVTPNLNVYETLVALNADYTLRPALAERWEFVEPNTWRFHLRPGVTFHDGQRFTADDVVWSWTERDLLPMSITSTLGPDSVRKVDDLTVDFTPVVPNRRLPEQMVSTMGNIVPNGKYNDSTPPAGTGPFRVVSYTQRREAVVERYDGYWGDKAKLDRLTMRFFPDREARVAALRNGQVDLALELSPDDIRAVEQQPDLRIARAEGSRQHVLFLNATGTPQAELMADRAVRQAVTLAIDRSGYVTKVLGGAGQPGRLVTNPAVLGPAAATVRPPAHDLAAAGRLLDGAGWRPGADGIRTKGGRPLHLTLIGDHQLPAATLPFVAEQLRQVGISTNVKRAEDRLTYDEYRLRPFDLDVKTVGQGNADPSAVPSFWLSSQIPEASAFAIGPPADTLIAQARAAATPEELQRLSAALMRLAQEDEAIFTPLADVPYLYGMNKAVDFPNPHPANQDWTQLRVNR